jgi:cytochrome c5
MEPPILVVRRGGRYNSRMAKHDRHFVNVFSAVLGILIAIALALIGISRLVDSGPKGARDTSDPLLQASAHERIKPFGQVAVAGEDNSALAMKQTAVPVVAGGAPAAGAAELTDGKAVFDSACVACHGSGIAGAPRIGDKEAWAPRIAQGIATLEQHAIGGFQGPAGGVMPAKGGRMDLSDEAVRMAVEHMVAQSR